MKIRKKCNRDFVKINICKLTLYLYFRGKKKVIKSMYQRSSEMHFMRHSEMHFMGSHDRALRKRNGGPRATERGRCFYQYREEELIRSL